MGVLFCSVNLFWAGAVSKLIAIALSMALLGGCANVAAEDPIERLPSAPASPERLSVEVCDARMGDHGSLLDLNCGAPEIDACRVIQRNLQLFGGPYSLDRSLWPLHEQTLAEFPNAAMPDWERLSQHEVDDLLHRIQKTVPQDFVPEYPSEVQTLRILTDLETGTFLDFERTTVRQPYNERCRAACDVNIFRAVSMRDRQSPHLRRDLSGAVDTGYLYFVADSGVGPPGRGGVFAPRYYAGSMILVNGELYTIRYSGSRDLILIYRFAARDARSPSRPGLFRIAATSTCFVKNLTPIKDDLDD